MSGAELTVWAPDGVAEVTAGTDLVALVTQALPDLRDGDVVVVTSKIVSKAEGRVVPGTREDALAGETVRTVARRGQTSIVENHLGLVMAAAGIDASNVEPGRLVLLPLDPDATARSLRTGLLASTGCNVAVLITDTAGRAWRHGQTDLAIGSAGMAPLDDHAGRVDGYGNPLAVTAPAVVDEIAGASDLVRGKLNGRPLARVRGLAGSVLPAGEPGAGSRSLTRALDEDMFGLGSREAVLAALAGESADAFGSPAPAQEVLQALQRLGISAGLSELAESTVTVHADPTAAALARVAAHALGWAPAPEPAPAGPTQATEALSLQPRTP